MSQDAIVSEVLPNGLRLVTERMPHVRSVSFGVWLTAGSRHEQEPENGIAHLVEHMLFKGTATRSQEDIAQAIDSIGGQMDAFTTKEYAGYYIKVLDDHLPVAVDILADILTRPAFEPQELEREQKVVLEEIKMVEDTPDDLVHELFTEKYWEGHPLGRPILGTESSVASMSAEKLNRYFRRVYVPSNLVVVAAGNIEHEQVRELVLRTFEPNDRLGLPRSETPPHATPSVLIRPKDLEQCHVCLGTGGHRQDHDDRHAGYVMNAILGGTMSSRLFQNVRERRGLAYSVYSGMSAYRDTGSTVIYAGCAGEAVAELIDVVVAEIRRMKREAVEAKELQRARDNLKGSLMLGLESTSSRMAHLARQAIYFDRKFDLDETLRAIDAVTSDDVQRVACELFTDDGLSATVLGQVANLDVPRERLALN